MVSPARCPSLTIRLRVSSTCEVGRLVLEPAQARIAVGHDRGQRLIDFVGNRCGHLAHGRQTRDVGELGLDRDGTGLVGAFALARPGEFGQHGVESDTEPSDLVLAADVGAQTIVLGFAHRPRQLFESLQRPHDMPVGQECDENAEAGGEAGEDEAQPKLAHQGVDPLLEQPVQLRMCHRPGVDRALHGVRKGGVLRTRVDGRRLAAG
jgi:hypothetical protein